MDEHDDVEPVVEPMTDADWQAAHVRSWEIRTGYHRPATENVIAAHEKVRATIRTAGLHLLELVPSSNERTRMLDALDDALMHANAGIARRHPDNVEAEGRA